MNFNENGEWGRNRFVYFFIVFAGSLAFCVGLFLFRESFFIGICFWICIEERERVGFFRFRDFEMGKFK